MRSPAQHPQTLQTLGDGSAEVMPYAQPAGQPPHGQGYYVAPTQMMPYSSEQDPCFGQYQIMSNITTNWAVAQQSHVNFALGQLANPPNAMLQYYSESDDKPTDPRDPPKDMETSRFR